jgi:hypothetical protein
MNKERNLTVTATCHRCGTEHLLRVNLDDWLTYESSVGLIQNILPYLTPAERELLISGTCGDCWEKMWS